MSNRIFAPNGGKVIWRTDFPVRLTMDIDSGYGDPLVNSGRTGCAPVGGDSAYG